MKITSRAFGQDLSMPITNAWRPFRAEEAELVAPDAELGPPPWSDEPLIAPEDEASVPPDGPVAQRLEQRTHNP